MEPGSPQIRREPPEQRKEQPSFEQLRERPVFEAERNLEEYFRPVEQERVVVLPGLVKPSRRTEDLINRGLLHFGLGLTKNEQDYLHTILLGMDLEHYEDIERFRVIRDRIKEFNEEERILAEEWARDKENRLKLRREREAQQQVIQEQARETEQEDFIEGFIDMTAVPNTYFQIDYSEAEREEFKRRTIEQNERGMFGSYPSKEWTRSMGDYARALIKKEFDRKKRQRLASP